MSNPTTVYKVISTWYLLRLDPALFLCYDSTFRFKRLFLCLLFVLLNLTNCSFIFLTNHVLNTHSTNPRMCIFVFAPLLQNWSLFIIYSLGISSFYLSLLCGCGYSYKPLFLIGRRPSIFWTTSWTLAKGKLCD